MKSAILAAAVPLAAASDPIHVPNKVMLFENFIKKYNRHYANDFEKGRRFQIFSENIDKIYESNAKGKSYTLGITDNTDKTFEEFKAQSYGFRPDPARLRGTGNNTIFEAPAGFTAPDSVDWVEKGGVTSVKNQGTCGSCWTFSAIGALEGAMFVAGRGLQDLSMQNLLACDTSGNGCGGGQMSQAFDWVQQNGLPSLKAEPYLCQDGKSSECVNMKCDNCDTATGETCIFGGCNKVADSVCDKSSLIHKCRCPSDKCFSKATNDCSVDRFDKPYPLKPGDVTGHTDVASTEGALEAAVAQQPVSVAIEADQSVFQHYTSGVLTSDACGSSLDHGVLAVGYGTLNGQKYWKVKNSWGADWGNNGYILIAKGSSDSGGECGIRKMASFPTVKPAEKDVVV